MIHAQYALLDRKYSVTGTFTLLEFYVIRTVKYM